MQDGILRGTPNAATARVPGFSAAISARERLDRCVTYLEQLGHPRLAKQLTRDVTPHLPPSLEELFLDRAQYVEALPDPAPTVERQHLERDLVAAYRKSLPYTVPQAHLEYPITAHDELLRADLLDTRRQRIVEAKASAAFGPVRDALLQADGYRHAANKYTDVLVEDIAVLLPRRPEGFALEYLHTRLPEFELTVTVIYPEGDQFAEEVFG